MSTDIRNESPSPGAGWSQGAPAKKPSAIQELKGFLEAPRIAEELLKILPPNLSPKRLIRQVITLAWKNPDLLQCSQLSIYAGLVQAAELQLELSGPMGQAYLVPRRNHKKNCWEVTFQVGYRGFITLAYRTGKIAGFPIRTVHTLDDFHVAYGTRNEIHHVPYHGEDPGEVTGFYAVCKFKDGGHDFEFMSRDQMDLFRKKYCSKNPFWCSEYEAMALKTVVRKLAKRLPLSVEFQQAAGDDSEDRDLLGDGQRPALIQSRADILADQLCLPGEAEPELDRSIDEQHEGPAE